MSLPTAAFFIVNEDSGTLFVREDDKSPWTLPSGKARSAALCYTDLAREALKPYFEALSIVSIKYLFTLKEEIVIGDRRAKCSVILAKVIGVPSPRADGRVCHMALPSVPLSALSSDISGIVSMLQNESRPA